MATTEIVVDDRGTEPSEEPRILVEAARHSRATGRLEIVLLLAVSLLVLLLGWQMRWTSDDGFINFRIVENLLNGDGPVFTPGLRVEAGTSPLWLVLIAAGSLLPWVGIEWSAVFLGIGLTAAGFFFAGLGGGRLLAGRAPLVVPAGLLIAACLPPFWDFASSGLETGLSFGWIGLSWWLCARCVDAHAPRSAYLWAAFVLGLGPLVRPDAAVVSVVFITWLLVVHRSWRGRVLMVLAAGVLPIAYQIFRMGYFGLLVPNTAVAKESSRALWGRGITYLTDFADAYGLYTFAVLAALLLTVVLASLHGDRRATGLVVAALLGAVIQILYVVRVGGDFMHARMLLPATFLALTTIAVVPLSRRWTTATLALLALTGVLSTVTAATDRVEYAGGEGTEGIADERGFWAGLAAHPRPVTLEDHSGNAFVRYGRAIADLRESGSREIVTQEGMHTPGTEISSVGESSDRLVFVLGNAGFLGVASGTETLALDGVGLTDSIGAHLEAHATGRPGHEKATPLVWFWARYGTDITPEARERGLTEADVAAAREALSCGDAAELLRATEEPLSWGRFWSNVGSSFALTDLRIPLDPQEAERALC
jgi:arabinofuranosyltransferase